MMSTASWKYRAPTGLLVPEGMPRLRSLGLYLVTCVGPGPGLASGLLARSCFPSSSRSCGVTHGSRESVTGSISDGSAVCAGAITDRENSTSASAQSRTAMTSPPSTTQKSYAEGLVAHATPKRPGVGLVDVYT